jgi:hypothetical protein
MRDRSFNGIGTQLLWICQSTDLANYPEKAASCVSTGWKSFAVCPDNPPLNISVCDADTRLFFPASEGLEQEAPNWCIKLQCSS